MDVLTTDFGSESIKEALHNIPRLDSIETRIMLQEQYEQDFGIYNHDKQPRPLSLVSMHPKENTVEAGSLFSLIRRYAMLNVKDTFGLSLTEWLNLPYDHADVVKHICSEEMKSKAKSAEVARREFNKQ